MQSEDDEDRFDDKAVTVQRERNVVGKWVQKDYRREKPGGITACRQEARPPVRGLCRPEVLPFRKECDRDPEQSEQSNPQVQNPVKLLVHIEDLGPMREIP